MSDEKRPAKVVPSKRGGAESWDCSACLFYTHADEETARRHIADKHPKTEKEER